MFGFVKYLMIALVYIVGVSAMFIGANISVPLFLLGAFVLLIGTVGIPYADILYYGGE